MLTSISLEHTALLGNTLTAIATEKMAIIKSPRQKVILAPQDPAVHKLILQHCQSLHIQPVVIEENMFGIEREDRREGQLNFYVRINTRVYSGLKLPTLGRFQLVNAAVGIGIIDVLPGHRFVIEEEAVRRGIASFHWPGRFEVLGQAPETILDAAHNPASVRMICREMKQLYGGKKIFIIAGFSKDKDVAPMLSLIQEISNNIILTQSHHPRALPCDQVHFHPRDNMVSFTKTTNVAQAIALTQEEATEQDVVLIIGSLFIVAEARQIIKDHGAL